MSRINLKKAAAAIKKHNRFLISAHTSPEGDALGSELGLYYLLTKLGKQAVIINEDPLPPEYFFLPGKESIKLYRPALKDINFDCAVILDCTDLGRTGEVSKLINDTLFVINIDHHISNKKFGSVDWVDPKSSSASEMVFRLYKEMRVPFDADAALLLYVGMMTDTGSFRYSNTSVFTHRAAGELLRFGLNVPLVYRNIYEKIPFTDMQLLIKTLSHIHRASGGKIVWVELPARLLRHKKLSFDLTDHILSFIRGIKDVQAAALFKENLGVKNEIRVNLRSAGLVDVNKVAQAFGGGGHRTASGCTVSGRLRDVRKKVIAKIRQDLK
ncbi:MAG: bifunctional oligoribonuclease/PAP phosphatase NrnA [Candidatus Omnitrophica bacterium]|nr:bifunctional oligoribonuclease/PAP phosphatase NrnA [Candidatus Omnitrophota bacterium]